MEPDRDRRPVAQILEAVPGVLSGPKRLRPLGEGEGMVRILRRRGRRRRPGIVESQGRLLGCDGRGPRRAGVGVDARATAGAEDLAAGDGDVPSSAVVFPAAGEGVLVGEEAPLRRGQGYTPLPLTLRSYQVWASADGLTTTYQVPP